MYIVSYDIKSNKQRIKIAKVMEGYGMRVQYSVFECKLTKLQYEQMYEKLVNLMQDEDGNIRIYSLCKTCEKDIRIIGTSNYSSFWEEKVVII